MFDDRWHVGFDRKGRRLKALSISENKRHRSSSGHTVDTIKSSNVTTNHDTSTTSPSSRRKTRRIIRTESQNTSATAPVLSKSAAARQSSSRHYTTAATSAASTLPPPIGSSTARQSDRHVRNHQHQLQERRQQKHRVRHHHKQLRRRQCFQFVKTAVSLKATDVPPPVFVVGQYVSINSRRASVKRGRVGGVGLSTKKPPHGSRRVHPSAPQSNVDAYRRQQPRHQGPPVNFRQVYANFGGMAAGAKSPRTERPNGPVDPT